MTGRRPKLSDKRPLQRREQELHQRPGRAEEPENLRGLAGIAADKIHHEFRQHRDDNAHGEHVQENRRKDEDEGGLAPRRTDHNAGRIQALVHQRRFRPA